MAANEILISGIQPLSAGDESYAFTAAVPVATPGLTFMSRRSYELAAASEFDNPLAFRFDENDAVAHFDNVRIPRERVFLMRDPARRRGSEPTSKPSAGPLRASGSMYLMTNKSSA